MSKQNSTIQLADDPQAEIALVESKLAPVIDRERKDNLSLALTQIELGYWLGRSRAAHGKIALENRDSQTGQLVATGGFAEWLEHRQIPRSSAYANIAAARCVGLREDSPEPDFSFIRGQLESVATIIGGANKLPGYLRKGPTTCQQCSTEYAPHLEQCPECEFRPQPVADASPEPPETLWKSQLKLQIGATLAGLAQARDAAQIAGAHARSSEAKKAKETLVAELRQTLEDLTDCPWDMLPAGSKSKAQFHSYREEFAS